MFGVMTTVTMFCFLPDAKILFTSESAAYLSSISDINKITSIIALAIFLISIITFKRTWLKPFLLITSFSIWLMSGRVSAIKPFPDGRVLTGWYYLRTGRFNLCDGGRDCEGTLSNKTQLAKLSLWNIHIKNLFIDRTVFIGPLNWNNCYEVFDKNIGP